jgi:hypothetical protein
VSEVLATYKSTSRTVGREEGVRMFRHTLDMLAEVGQMQDHSSRPVFHTDMLVQVRIVRNRFRVIYPY